MANKTENLVDSTQCVIIDAQGKLVREYGSIVLYGNKQIAMHDAKNYHNSKVVTMAELKVYSEAYAEFAHETKL